MTELSDDGFEEVSEQAPVLNAEGFRGVGELGDLTPDFSDDDVSEGGEGREDDGFDTWVGDGGSEAVVHAGVTLGHWDFVAIVVDSSLVVVVFEGWVESGMVTSRASEVVVHVEDVGRGRV